MRPTPLAVILAALAPTGAAADSFYDRIAERGGAIPCFARIYDADHLSHHPRQRVTHFFLRHSEVDDLTPPESFDVVIGYKLKGSADSFVTEAGCAAEGADADCGAEGDAGSFRLAPHPEGMLVVIDDRLHLEGHVSFSPDLAKDGDDSPILLRPSPTSDCHFE
jgi:hypothetical protein